MIRTRNNLTARLGCAPGSSCCNKCRMGAADTSDFQAFLDANPDLKTAVAEAQQANPSDPVLRNVMYNPVTNVFGPVALPQQESGYDPGPAATPATFMVIGVGILAALILFDSGGGRRR